MKIPQEKYDNDITYRNLVDTMESLIHAGQFTPSELREAAVFASIRYEMRREHIYRLPLTSEIEEALEHVEKIRIGEKP